MERKPILCLDFDGVLHSYESGWTGIDSVKDGPTPGAMDFLRRAVQLFTVAIVSSRSEVDAGRNAMKSALDWWLIDELGGPAARGVIDEIYFPTSKPACFLTIDDRAIQFDGTFPPPSKLLGFTPWNKKDRS